MCSILLLIVLMICILINAGYTAQVGHKLRDHNILHKYFQPIQRLIKNLPNHDVEIQLELAGTTPYPGTLAPQRRFRVKRLPKKMNKQRRRQNDVELPASETLESTTTTEIQTTVASTTTAASTTITTSLPERIETTRKPVYMEDLNKAMDAFEKKITGKNKDTEAENDNEPLLKKHLFEALGCKGHKHKEDEHKESHMITSQTKQFNVNRILSILQKGIEIKRDVPTPNEDNLHWMQIKIPKALDIHV